MKTRIVAIAASALLFPACLRPFAQPTAGLTPEDLEGVSSEDETAAPGQVGLVTLSTTGEHPVRGNVYWTGSGADRTLVSRSCGEDDNLWFCARDRWLVGENRRAGIDHPARRSDALLVAADLGIPVIFGADAKTIIYLGDSAGRPTRNGCGSIHPRVDCNDAMLVVDPGDADPADGLSTQVVSRLAPDGGITGFVPLLVPGVNGRDALRPCDGRAGRKGGPACLGAFNVPTGAAAVRLKSSLVPGAPKDAAGETDAVVMFFATAITRGEATSWLAVSTDGYFFARLSAEPFSRDRFIQVAPVALRADARRALCAATPESPLCDASLGIGGDALLLFGDGETYRESRLYLAVLGLDDLRVRYYRVDPGTGRETWVSEEGAATPIVSDAGAGRFGELSVSLVGKEACPADARASCADALVLLSNDNGIVRYRTAALAFPGARGSSGGSAWSAERKTSGQGYGPYAIGRYTRVERGARGGLELVLYHTISSWNGRAAKAPDRAPYGVFTRRLMLLDDATCRSGAAGGPLCDELPPPWPPGP
jgi:hypothetical protein